MGLSLKATLMSGALGLSLSFGSMAAPKKTASAPEPARAFFACAYQLDAPEKKCIPVDLKGVNKNEDKELAPASLNKLMTAHLVLQQVQARATEQGRTLDSVLNDEFVKVTPEDTAAGRIGERNGKIVGGGHILPLPEEHTLTYREAILALTVYSANNVAEAAARALSPDGSRSGFVKMMNDEAAVIGMAGTTLKTPSGMPATGQVTTAADMSALVHHIAKVYGVEKFDELFGQKSATIAGREVPGHLRLLRNPEIIGGKTGADNDGKNVSGIAQRQNIGLAFTTLGSPSASTRDSYTLRMIDKIFSAILMVPNAEAKAAPPPPKQKATKQTSNKKAASTKKKAPAKGAKAQAATKKAQPQP